MTKKGELDAEAKSCDREIKVQSTFTLELHMQLVCRLVYKLVYKLVYRLVYKLVYRLVS